MFKHVLIVKHRSLHKLIDLFQLTPSSDPTFHFFPCFLFFCQTAEVFVLSIKACLDTVFLGPLNGCVNFVRNEFSFTTKTSPFRFSVWLGEVANRPKVETHKTILRALYHKK